MCRICLLENQTKYFLTEKLIQFQICKAILANEKERKSHTAELGATTPTTASAGQSDAKIAQLLAATGGVPLPLVARCARDALAAISAACADSCSGWDAGRVGVVRRLVEAEVLPQAGRWHRRDLVPGLEATWRAVLRNLPSPVADAVSCLRHL